jgi:hypothetical protein
MIIVARGRCRLGETARLYSADIGLIALPTGVFTRKDTSELAGSHLNDAVKEMWTVIHLGDVGPSVTRLQIVGVGYSDDDESRKHREFFNRGDAYTLKKLHDKFAGKSKRLPGGG